MDEEQGGGVVRDGGRGLEDGLGGGGGDFVFVFVLLGVGAWVLVVDGRDGETGAGQQSLARVFFPISKEAKWHRERTTGREQTASEEQEWPINYLDEGHAEGQRLLRSREGGGDLVNLLIVLGGVGV